MDAYKTYDYDVIVIGAGGAGLRAAIEAHGQGVKAYSCVSCLNRKHMAWAWFSLFTVGFSDLYVRLCSMGVWSDLRIW